METATRTDRASSQIERLIMGGIWRNRVAGLDARARHRMAWLLRPRHMPKQPIGKRRRNGHFLSFGRSMSSESCNKDDKKD